MKRIPRERIANADVFDGVEQASVVDTACPRCGRWVSLQPNWKYQGARDGLNYGFARCPACERRSAFILLTVDWHNGEDGALSAHYIAPAPSAREPIPGFSQIPGIPSTLADAYTSSVNVFNFGEWPSATVACRRVLEGIAKTTLPSSEQGKRLYQQIEELPKHVDFAKMFKDLAHQLRDGGNLGAHFDMTRTPTPEVAEMMLDLLDNLIEYLFVLPHRIRQLESRIQNLGAQAGKTP